MLFSITALILSIASAQVAPYGLNVQDKDAILVFTPTCAGPTSINIDMSIKVLFISPQYCSGQKIYYDEGLLWHRIFYINKYPTIILLKQGVEAYRTFNIKEIATLMYNKDKYKTRYEIGIRPGSNIVIENHNNYTGFIVVWKNDCKWCKKEANQINTLCRREEVLIVSDTNRQPDQLPDCKEVINWEYYNKWNIPGAPTHAFVEKGVILWIDVGYRPDLLELAKAKVRGR